MNEAIIGLVGVVIGSVITIGKDAWTSSQQRKKNAAYAAIRLICILEEYSQKCVDVVADDGTSCGRPAGATDSGEEFYEAQVSQPLAPVFPDSIDWQSLDVNIMHRILELPNSARNTDLHIIASSEHAYAPGYEEYFEARQCGYARLGLEAIEIVEFLRVKYNFPSRYVHPSGSHWTPKKYLKDALDEFERHRENYTQSGFEV